MTVVDERKPPVACRCCDGWATELRPDLCVPCWDALYAGVVPHDHIHVAAHSQLEKWGVLKTVESQPFRGEFT